MFKSSVVSEVAKKTVGKLRRSLEAAAPLKPAENPLRAHLAAYQLLADLKQSHGGRTVRMLDIGGAEGVHARFFREHGVTVDLLEAKSRPEAIFVGDYLDFKVDVPYDIVWSSHVLEHVPNVGLFLDKMHQDLHADGYCVVSVPPIKEWHMAFGHVSLWNPGILLLNAAKHGFDPVTARVAQYGYNVSLIARKRTVPCAKSLSDEFPAELRAQSPRHFRGDVKFVNWEVRGEALSVLPGVSRSESEALERVRQSPGRDFCMVRMGRFKKRMFWYDRTADTLRRCC